MLDFECDLDSIFLDVIGLNQQENKSLDKSVVLQLQDWCLDVSEPVITFRDSITSTDVKKSPSPTSVSEEMNAFSIGEVPTKLAQKNNRLFEFEEGGFNEPRAPYEDRNELAHAKPPAPMSGMEATSDRDAQRKLARAQRRQSDVYKRKEKARRQRDKMRRSILRNKCIALEVELRHMITQARRVGSQISRCVLESWWEQSDGAIQAYRVLITKDWRERINLI